MFKIREKILVSVLAVMLVLVTGCEATTTTPADTTNELVMTEQSGQAEESEATEQSDPAEEPVDMTVVTVEPETEQPEGWTDFGVSELGMPDVRVSDDSITFADEDHEALKAKVEEELGGLGEVSQIVVRRCDSKFFCYTVMGEDGKIHAYNHTVDGESIRLNQVVDMDSAAFDEAIELCNERFENDFGTRYPGFSRHDMNYGMKWVIEVNDIALIYSTTYVFRVNFTDFAEATNPSLALEGECFGTYLQGDLCLNGVDYYIDRGGQMMVYTPYITANDAELDFRPSSVSSDYCGRLSVQVYIDAESNLYMFIFCEGWVEEHFFHSLIRVNGESATILYTDSSHENYASDVQFIQEKI